MYQLNKPVLAPKARQFFQSPNHLVLLSPGLQQPPLSVALMQGPDREMAKNFPGPKNPWPIPDTPAQVLGAVGHSGKTQLQTLEGVAVQVRRCSPDLQPQI